MLTRIFVLRVMCTKMGSHCIRRIFKGLRNPDALIAKVARTMSPQCIEACKFHVETVGSVL